MSFTGCRPVFEVADLGASIAYYTGALGFTLEWIVSEPAEDAKGHEPGATAHVYRGGFELLLRVESDPVGPAEVVVGMTSAEEVDRVHEEYRRSGAIVREPPTRRPWGTYEMYVLDLDGHLLRVLC